MSNELQLHTSPLIPGLTVIEASAGTGKTYSISHLVPRLLLEGTLPDLSKLLLVTFTKDAARELCDRVRKVLTQLGAPPAADESTKAKDIAELRLLLTAPEAQARLSRALLDLDLLSVSTIHAFCQRTLQQEGTLCGLPVLPEVITDDTEHLAPIVSEQWITTLSASPTLAALATVQKWSLPDTLKFINTLRRCLRPRSEPAVERYEDLIKRIPALASQLADTANWTALQEILSTVNNWKAGAPADSADAIAQLSPLIANETHTTAYWRCLPLAAALTDKIFKKEKAAHAALETSPWFAAARELHELTSRLLWSWQHHLAAESMPRLEIVMARHRLITQDGLIGALYHALHRPGTACAEQSSRLADRIADRYHVALIDESQDTDPRQFAIFKRIFLDARPKRQLLLVGDPKQAIYSFRGADLATYLATRDSAKADARFTLTRTYRAPQPLVAAINTLFDRQGSFLNPGMAFTPAESALTYDYQLIVDGCPSARLETWIVADDADKNFSAKARRSRALS